MNMRMIEKEVICLLEKEVYTAYKYTFTHLDLCLQELDADAEAQSFPAFLLGPHDEW